MQKHLSPSQIGMFIRCAQQYERRYMLGEKIPPGIQMHQGTSLHEAAKVNHLQKIDSWVDLPEDVLTDAARDAFNLSLSEKGFRVEAGQDPTQQIGRGLDNSVRLTRLYLQEVAPTIQPVMAEETMMVDMGLDLPLMVILDAYTIDNRVPDLKTSRKAKTQAEVDTSLQLTAYAGAIKAHVGEWPGEVSLENLIIGKTPKHQSLVSYRDEADWGRLVARAALMIEQIRAGLFPPCAPDSWACNPKWCGYWQACRYARR